MTHSPEPWTIIGDVLRGAVECHIYDAGGRLIFDGLLDEVDATRICLAVNFCRSFTNEELDFLSTRPASLAHVRGMIRQWLEANRENIERTEKQESP